LRRPRTKRLVVITEEGDRLVVKPTTSLEDAFGVDGEGMKDVAREISRDRRAEIESERP
jgi:virulence-associated protein VagC